MTTTMTLPAFAEQDGFLPAEVAALHPAVVADGRALRFRETDATGATTGTLVMHGHGRYSYSPGGWRSLLVLDATSPSSDGAPPRLLVASGAYAALAAAAMATAPSVTVAPGGGWNAVSRDALLALIHQRRIDDVLVLEQPADRGRGHSWAVAAALNAVYGATLLPRVLELPDALPALLRAQRVAGRRAA